MGRLSNTFAKWPLGARNSSASSPTSIRFGSYIDAVLIVHASVASGSFVPYWQTSDGSHFADVARGVTMGATGTQAIALTTFGNVGRPRWVVSAGANFTASFTVVAKE